MYHPEYAQQFEYDGLLESPEGYHIRITACRLQAMNMHRSAGLVL